MFDWSITFGNFLTILVLGAGGIGFIYTMRGQVDAMSERLRALEDETKKLVDVLIIQGRQDERLNAMDIRMVAQGHRIDETIDRLNRVIDERRA